MFFSLTFFQVTSVLQLSFIDIKVQKILLVDSPQMFVVNLELLEVSRQAVSNLSDRSVEK